MLFFLLSFHCCLELIQTDNSESQVIIYLLPLPTLPICARAVSRTVNKTVTGIASFKAEEICDKSNTLWRIKGMQFCTCGCCRLVISPPNHFIWPEGHKWTSYLCANHTQWMQYTKMHEKFRGSGGKMKLKSQQRTGPLVKPQSKKLSEEDQDRLTEGERVTFVCFGCKTSTLRTSQQRG